MAGPETQAHSTSPPSDRATMVLAIVHLLFAVLVIAGWVYDVPRLRGAAFGTFVAPNSALLFMVSALAVLAQRLVRPASAARVVGLSLGIFVAIFSALALAQRFVSVDLHIESFFLRSTLKHWNFPGVPAGRMAIPTCCAFVLVGMAIAFLSSRMRFIVDLCASGVFATGYLAVLGYVYGQRTFYGYVMALGTAVMLLGTSALLVAAAEQSWLRSVALSNNAGGIMIRRLSPVFLVLMPSFGWLRLRAESYGWLPHPFATALFASGSVLIFAAIALLIASKLNGIDARRKQTETALLRTEKLATAGRLAATVAHEINNPLEAALNSVFLARSSGVNEVAEKYLSIAERELQRVAALARRSLGFYRSQESSERTDLSHELTEVVELLRPQADVKHVTLEARVAKGLLVVAAPGELRQIFTNLVVNALTATNAGGQVFLGAFDTGDNSEIRVTDTGHGIPAEVRDRIFEPFFTTGSKSGLGLGLYVVQELVTRNGGTLTCESSTRDDQHGTTFTIVLPRATAPRAAAAS